MRFLTNSSGEQSLATQRLSRGARVGRAGIGTAVHKCLGVPLLVIAGVAVTVPAYAQSEIELALDALKFTVKRTTSIAITYAAAHTAGGTAGGPGLSPGGCLDFHLTGAGASCGSSDFFPHPPPIGVKGNDVALASAFGSSWALGFRGTATANATAMKGDFAIAGAYARGGAAASAIGGSLASTGLTKASASFSLGGLTISGSKDPTDSFYGFMVTDQDPSVLNQTLLSEDVQGTKLGPLVSADVPPDLTTGLPAHVFYALFLRLDGATGNLDVLNYGLSVTTPLTAADFEDHSTAMTSVKELKGAGDFTIDIPFEDLASSEQAITFDTARLAVAAGAVPEPPTVVLTALGMLVLLGYASWRSKAGAK
jgi:hypothetical protein